jgi:hypothetical protein
MNPKNHARAVRYRQLALAETDKDKAAVLYKIADEAERDVLCTVDRMNGGLDPKPPKAPPKPPSNLL